MTKASVYPLARLLERWQGPRPRRARLPLGVELLEDRCVPSSTAQLFQDFHAFDPSAASGTVVLNGTDHPVNADSGASDKGGELSPLAQPGTLPKETGAGGPSALVAPAPIEIGNRVWLDANGNGIQDARETGIARVTVELFDPSGARIASAVTDSAGNYSFSSGPGTNTTSAAYNLARLRLGTTGYTVRLDNPRDYAAGGPLAGLIVTRAFAGADPGIDSNGQAVRPTDVRAVVDTGGAPASGRTLDIGFTRPLSLGDFVWYDANNNGVLNVGEPGFGKVRVDLLDGSGQPILDAGGNPLTTTTDKTGHYRFTGLLPGTYEVQVTPPAGFVSSTGTNGSTSGPFEPGAGGNLNDRDHGTQSGARVRSAPVTLGPVGSPLNPDGVAGNADLRQDFGLIGLLSVGNFVFNDLNDNGLADPGEPGLANVTVRLRDAYGNVLTTITNAQGGYLFSALRPGAYRVEVVTPSGFQSSTGSPGSATGPFEPAPDNNVDNQDKGTTAGAIVQGGPIDLEINRGPTGETPTPGGIVDRALDANSNLTQDFGFFQPTAGFGGSASLPEAGLGSQPLAFGPLDLLGSNLGSDAPVGVPDANTAFVNRLYADVLGRPADAVGASALLAALQAGLSRASAADILWQSPEHRGLEVDRLYQRILHRSADPSGRAAFVQLLQSGATENDVARDLIASPEYAGTHPDTASFAAGLYTDLLGHAPDQAGLSALQQALESGTTRSLAADFILRSAENQQAVVDGLFQTILHRHADSVGEQAALGLLQSGGMVDVLATILLGSPEYFHLA